MRTNGGHLWADRYDRDLTDIFAVQDEVTHADRRRAQGDAQPGRKRRAWPNSETSNIVAYDCVLRGREIHARQGKEPRDVRGRRSSISRRRWSTIPIIRKPMRVSASRYMFDYQNRWSDDPDKSLQVAKEYAQQAIEKDPNEPLARCVAALAAILRKGPRPGQGRNRSALALNPSSGIGAQPPAARSGPIPDSRSRRFRRSSRRCASTRRSSQQFLHFLGIAYLMAGKYETAAAMLRQRIILVPEHGFFPRHACRQRSAISARSRRRGGCGPS